MKRCLVLVALLSLAGPLRGDSAKSSKAPSRMDADGFPLPEGAYARLGSPRISHVGATTIRYLPKRRNLVTIGPDVNNPGFHVVRFWEINSAKLAQEWRLNAYYNAFTFSNDEKLVAAITSERKEGQSSLLIKFWDTATGKQSLQAPLDCKDVPFKLIFSPDDQLVALVVTGEKLIRLLDVSSGKDVRQLKGHGHIISLNFSRDGKRLISGGMDGTLRHWDPATGEEVEKINIDKKPSRVPAQPMALSADGRAVVALPSKSGAPQFWLFENGKLKYEFVVNSEENRKNLGLSGADFSPDGQFVILRASLGQLHFWDVTLGKKVFTLEIGRRSSYDRFLGYTLLPNKTLITLTQTPFNVHVQFWDLEKGSERLIPGHRGRVCRVAFSPDGKWIASVAQDDTLCLWDAATGKEVRNWPVSIQIIASCLAFSPDGKYLVGDQVQKSFRSSETKWGVGIWEVTTGKLMHRLPDTKGPAAFSPDGKMLATTDVSGVLQLWDVANGKEVAKTPQPRFPPLALAFSPDGKHVMSGHGNGFFTWDLSGKQVSEFSTQSRQPSFQIAFSDDLRRAVGFLPNERCWLWDLGAKKDPVSMEVEMSKFENAKIGNVTVIPEESHFFAFSPDGRMLIGSHYRRSLDVIYCELRFWEIASGKLRAKLEKPQNFNVAIAISPNGRTVACCHENCVLLYDISGGQGENSPKEEPVLSAQERERLWGNFALRDDEGVKKQFRDRNTLIQSPRQAVAFLRERLKPVAAPDSQLIERRLDELDSNDFATREKATAELEKLGALAEPAIRKKLEGKLPSLEGRRRMERILEKLKNELSADDLRAIRAVEVLENIANPAAKELLESWSRGAPGARLTEEARSARGLLHRRTKAAEPSR